MISAVRHKTTGVALESGRENPVVLARQPTIVEVGFARRFSERIRELHLTSCSVVAVSELARGRTHILAAAIWIILIRDSLSRKAGIGSCH